MPGRTRAVSCGQAGSCLHSEEMEHHLFCSPTGCSLISLFYQTLSDGLYPYACTYVVELCVVDVMQVCKWPIQQAQ